MGDAVARCGCSNTCSCSVVAGAGVTVTGVGSTTDPYVISGAAGSFTASDTSTVDHTLTGAGTLSDPYVLTSNVKVSPSAVGNLITILGDGLAVTCESVQDCVGQALDDGLEYDDANNQIRAKLSTDVGNSIAFGTDGGLYSTGGGGGGGLTFVSTTDTNCIDLSGNGTALQPLTAAPVVSPVAGNLLSCAAGGLRALLTVGACGLTGNGSAASPLAARVGAWPFPCSVDTFAGNVYCDSSGTLRSEPRGRTMFNQNSQNTSYANLAVPAGFDVLIESRTLLIENPDTCRSSFVLVSMELDVDFILPANAGAAAGLYTDEMQFHSNRGGTTETDYHVQVMKVVYQTPDLPPGGSNNFGVDISMGRGAGGATYNRIQTFIRAFQWIL